jgi:phosphoglycolate phosphatase
MKKKEVAVTFPGIGYHNDKPLLYYSGKLLKELGYELIKVGYDFPFQANSIKGDTDQMKSAFDLALKQAEEQLAETDFSSYDQILFVGKSIGTAVAAAYDQKHAVGAKHIIFTPIPQTFNLLHTGCGIVYHGNADPWCETALAIEKCSSLDLPLHIITGANHSLETKSVTADIQNMSEILWQIVEYTELL